MLNRSTFSISIWGRNSDIQDMLETSTIAKMSVTIYTGRGRSLHHTCGSVVSVYNNIHSLGKCEHAPEHLPTELVTVNGLIRT